ncbi:hypothetical protein MSG37_19145 [Shewanella sp. 1CM18E]|uniref:hypothetical protein n=1 Tax=Shewanella sp. 1CM18E TaxID=2929169 RepID=UPI0020BFBD85|nr:hypothetical protein [Shewanella sp. 1CM18E]MCK8047009.1 hypothetical protein [Shewanella sp. 1CM18E]
MNKKLVVIVAVASISITSIASGSILESAIKPGKQLSQEPSKTPEAAQTKNVCLRYWAVNIDGKKCVRGEVISK